MAEQQISLKRQQQGNISAIKAHKEGRGSPFCPYTCETETLRSCDIFTPLKINLLSVRQLAYRLKEQIGSAHFPQKVHKISYVVPETVPNKKTNLAVADLLQQCKNLKGPEQ